MRLVVGIREAELGRKPSPMLKLDVIGGHDVADVVPAGVEEVFLMMREAPRVGHDAAAARNNARHAGIAVRGTKRSSTPAWTVK